jgi:hypothetical protein
VGGLVGEMAIIEAHMPRSATVIAGTFSAGTFGRPITLPLLVPCARALAMPTQTNPDPGRSV